MKTVYQLMRLNLPEYKFRIKQQHNKRLIFDEVRKRFVALTPEEWVRQHFIRFLIEEKHYPISLLAIEKGIAINGNTLRCDIVGYSRNGNPQLIVECKAPEVNITQDVFNQIVRYNMKLKVPLLVVTNGIKHYCCVIDYNTMNYRFVEEVPDYNDQLQEE